MITVAGSLIAGFALTPIAEMDMSNAPEGLRLMTLTGCLVVIVSACFTVYIACESIISGTRVAYRDNKSVEDVWQASTTSPDPILTRTLTLTTRTRTEPELGHLLPCLTQVSLRFYLLRHSW